jgi:hypothetical protein
MTGDRSPGKESAIMGDIEGIVTLIIGIAGVLCIPVLVWVTVIAGLYQIVRDKVRETHSAQTDLVQEVH